MEIIQTGVVVDRNVMWRNFEAHSIPYGVYEGHDTFELDFNFRRDLDPEAALQKISDWHRCVNKAFLTMDEHDKSHPSTLLFVCNDYKGLREFDEFAADYRGLLAVPKYNDSAVFMREVFPEFKGRGFRVSSRPIPLSIYARVYEAQKAWFEPDEISTPDAD